MAKKYMLALLPSPDDSVVDLSLHGRGAVSWERSCFMGEELFHERVVVS